MAGFIGTYSPKLDDKGRLTLPAKFRNALSGGVVVTKALDHSLAVYPAEEFGAIAQRANQASRNDPEARAYVRLMMANADEQSLDGQGRVNLSAGLRAWAGLQKDCVVTGQFDHLEIWDAAAWDAYQAAHEEAFAAGGSAALDAIL
ncbi:MULTISPECIES: division/cell wall cluster transcriptional repressor MraZ [unclassified Gordonia (in: high G+C Gram-positive bacteria)]|uniref:division/cell wall cluster transcriptional repressor MraZ n=1 Tax=unclassified Gordonia (in: high G+C Gram-positive bacteria) TaxID=2657482 RepID=UPI00200032B3|nr:MULTISPECIES: division/cell wall cluster transcriptional repressor MraZ [unclassified Gordonia (in: high G+C Gram-positive bacteria)]UQE73591.1 division/cell wall cluster transcriptional repressor MraZ [Gordonia sp. PP30]